jgi:hypothetical protein
MTEQEEYLFNKTARLFFAIICLLLLVAILIFKLMTGL